MWEYRKCINFLCQIVNNVEHVMAQLKARGASFPEEVSLTNALELTREIFQRIRVDCANLDIHSQAIVPQSGLEILENMNAVELVIGMLDNEIAHFPADAHQIKNHFGPLFTEAAANINEVRKQVQYDEDSKIVAYNQFYKELLARLCKETKTYLDNKKEADLIDTSFFEAKLKTFEPNLCHGVEDVIWTTEIIENKLGYATAYLALIGYAVEKGSDSAGLKQNFKMLGDVIKKFRRENNINVDVRIESEVHTGKNTLDGIFEREALGRKINMEDFLRRQQEQRSRRTAQMDEDQPRRLREAEERMRAEAVERSRREAQEQREALRRARGAQPESGAAESMGSAGQKRGRGQEEEAQETNEQRNRRILEEMKRNNEKIAEEAKIRKNAEQKARAEQNAKREQEQQNMKRGEDAMAHKSYAQGVVNFEGKSLGEIQRAVDQDNMYRCVKPYKKIGGKFILTPDESKSKTLLGSCTQMGPIQKDSRGKYVGYLRNGQECRNYCYNEEDEEEE